MGPLGLDDSNLYISRIQYFKEYQPFTFPKMVLDNSLRGDEKALCLEFTGFLWAYFLGKCSNIFGFSSYQAFSYNFYLGIFLMGITLFIFLKTFGKNSWYTTIALLFFAVYSGGGSYHGFFWVVPSFYALMIFMLLCSAIRSKKWQLWALLLVPILLFVHVSSLYLLCLFISTFGFYSIMNGQIKKYSFVILTVIIIATVFWGGYKIALANYLTFPLFCENYYEYLPPLKNKQPIYENKYENKLEAKRPKILKNNINSRFMAFWNTSFNKYFLFFFPLILFGIYFTLRDKKLFIISFFLSSSLGAAAVVALTSNVASRRVFLFWEIAAILIVSYAFFASLKLLSDNFEKWKIKKWPALAIAIYGIVFGIYLFLNQLEMDFDMKSRNQRHLRRKLLTNYLNETKNSKSKLLFQAMPTKYTFPLFRTFQGSWSLKNFKYFYSIRENFALNIRNSSDNILLAYNYLYNKNNNKIRFKRKGAYIHWPSRGALLFDKVPAGEYFIEFHDSNISPLEAKNISISPNLSKNCPLIVKNEKIITPLKMPPLLTPWHYLSLKAINFLKPDYFVIRKTYVLKKKFTIEEPAFIRAINDNNNSLKMMGTIKITDIKTGKTIKHFDFDNDTADKINSLKLSVNGNQTLLTWKLPSHLEHFPSLKLDKNFGDIKAFTFSSHKKIQNMTKIESKKNTE